MKQQITILLMLMNLTPMLGQELINKTLIQVKENEKVGFINFDGKEIIPVEFDAVKWFSEDILPVNKGAVEEDHESVGGRWGFWNREGKEIIPLKYEDAKIFREGLAPVKLNGKYGFINFKDEVKIDFQYEDAEPFKENLAAVKIGGKWGFIDKSGNLIISPAFHRVEDFNNGFSVVFHLIEQYEYEDDGYTYTEENGKYGLIDKEGKLKLDTIYEYIDKFVNGFAQVSLEMKEGFINLKGEIAIPIQFDKVENFSEGFAVVANYIPKAKMQESAEELMHGYINEKGEVVIALQFHEAEEFKNGLAQVRLGHTPMLQHALVDKKGNRLPSPGEKVGMGANLIDVNGKLQLDKSKQILNRCSDSIFITYSYEGARAFKESLEEIIFPNRYRNLSYLGFGLFVGELMNSNKKTLLGNGVKLELDENYWQIKAVAENRIMVDYIVARELRRITSKLVIMNEKGEIILKPKYDFWTLEIKE